MDKQRLIEKITSKKEFSQLPKKDVELIFSHFEKRQTTDEEKIKLTRDLLRKVYSVFASGKLLNKKILNKKTPEEILKKHLSTRERFCYYLDLYKRVLMDFDKVSIIDFGAGINGFSYSYFPKNKKINYIGVEAVGQLAALVGFYFKKNKLKAQSIHGSLFELEKMKNLIKKIKGKKIVFLFKVIDSMEMVERNYSKEFLKEIAPLTNKIVVSFATRSLIKKTRFKVKRFWFENFVKENFEFLDDFELGNERYLVFENKKRL